MDETQFDDEIKVESVDESTDFSSTSSNNGNFRMGLPKGSRLNSPNNVYVIEKLLGHGSFGITYLAKCNGKEVAVKEFFMHQFCGRDNSTYEVTGSSPGNQIEYYGKKFKLEAANLKKLKHDNIVKVYETFEANNTFYYSMEYIDGQSLDSYIKNEGALNEEDAVDCMLSISDAIKYMHSKKMLHLDLKPSNVMLSSSGQYYVIDFGLSKQFDENGEPESSSNIGLGTPGYAPTEQIEHNGKLFAPWIDVYALGGVFFKMLTGNTPPTASEVLNSGLPIDELKSHGVSKATISLVKSMMEPIWKKRILDVETVIKKLPLSHRQKLEELKKNPNIDAETIETVSQLPEYGGEGVDFSYTGGGILTRGVLGHIFVVAVIFLIDFALIATLIESLITGEEWKLKSWGAILFAAFLSLIVLAMLAWSSKRKVLRIELIILCVLFTLLRIAQIDWSNIDFLQSSFKNRISGIGEVTYNVGDVQFTMIPIEPSTFVMGGDGFEYDGDIPHKVTITKKYFLSETEVTQALWKEVMGTYKGDCMEPDLPVTNVSYEESLDFIEKLNKRLGTNFRLPTEAEWEFGARGGKKSKNFKFSGSSDINEVAWYNENSHGRLHPVATKKPNELGLYDMTGNAEEWCQDYYVTFKSKTALVDPVYVEDPLKGHRVARGGHYNTPDHSMTAKFHAISDYNFEPQGSGIRLAM